ncbi:MAG: sensor domain-containing diguanylate cyclase [Proteobacteria bacterium]|nr:sensor domain-containing diguanylate cyclase [Pseudomonadota bacterium]
MTDGFSFRDIVRLSSDAVIVVEALARRGTGPRIVYTNDAFSAITGIAEVEAIGATPDIIQGPKTPAYAQTRIQGAFDLQLSIREVVTNETKTGREYWLELNIIPMPDAQGRVTHFALIGRDLTDLRETEHSLRVAASTDLLTGFANRRTFMERAAVEFSRARRHRHTLAVVVCDIDHFRQVNDQHGHFVGDELLKAVAGAITAELRTTDVCGRLGGEEFAMLLPETPAPSAAEVADRLRGRVRTTYVEAEAGPVNVTVSAGATVTYEEDADFGATLQRAYQALYKSKGSPSYGTTLRMNAV